MNLALRAITSRFKRPHRIPIDIARPDTPSSLFDSRFVNIVLTTLYKT
jgi:hypothetical protein